MNGGDVLGHTRSLCPVCLKSLDAALERREDSVFITRTCPEHGVFSGLVWRGEPALERWHRPKQPSLSVGRETVVGQGCPHDCGRCPEHGQHACTVLFEITDQCNLRCPVCFADAGGETPGGSSRTGIPILSKPVEYGCGLRTHLPGPGPRTRQMGVDSVPDSAMGTAASQPASSGPEGAGGRALYTALPILTEQLQWIREHAGEVVLQISGGEPTLHPDLPELVRAAREMFPAVQLNTNGLLLADRPGLAEALARAGLSWVFLQFDGTDDAIFTALRGRPLLQSKLRAIERCRQAGLAVVLVPTVAAGVNDHDLGNLLRLAIRHAPTVRGLHLQPMTAAGRNALAQGSAPLTLPEVLRAICDQSGGLMRPEHATPPGCEHERCSFHCRYRLSPSGALTPLRGDAPCCVRPDVGGGDCCPGPGQAERESVSGTGAAPDIAPAPGSTPDATLEGARRAIDTIMRVWQPSDAPGTGAAAPAGDAFDAFIRQARNRSFSVTCMAFQDARNVDLARLRGCCVHVYAPPARLVPFCAYNMTALDGTALHRKKESSAREQPHQGNNRAPK